MPEVAGRQIWAVGGWVTWVIWCFSQKLCTRCDVWAGVLLWWSCQSPFAHSCGLLSHPNSFCGGMFKLSAKFGAASLALLSHFEFDSHTVHRLTLWRLPPHWLVQWSHHCSHVRIPVHSSSAARLPWCHANHFCYINNGCAFSGKTLYVMFCFWNNNTILI